MDVVDSEIKELVIEAAGAEVIGSSGCEPIYGIPFENKDGGESYKRLEIPEWLARFVELLLERHGD